MNKEKKIPTIIAILILIIAVFATTYLISLTAIFTSKASSDCGPVSIQVTNLTHHSADLSFLTSQKCLIDINVNNQLISNSIQSAKAKSQIHYFQINGLKENSTYQYTVISNGKTIKNSQFLIETPIKLNDPVPDSNLAWGKVLQSDGQPASAAILYLNIPDSAPLSSFVTSEGNWNIPLNTSYNIQKNSWFLPPENTTEDITVLSSDGQITSMAGNTSNNDPVPDIIIGQGFSFNQDNKEEKKLGSIPAIKELGQAIEKELSIFNPKDNEFLSTQQPEFFGTAPSGVVLTIQLHSSDEFNSQTQSDARGNWRWSPSRSLSPGQHSFTISFTHPETGQKESITKNFTVLAAQHDPGFTASSSAQQPTNIPTSIPTPTNTPIPTITTSPTPTTTTLPTITIRTAKPSTDSQVPTTAFMLPTILPFLLSISAIIVALILI